MTESRWRKCFPIFKKKQKQESIVEQAFYAVFQSSFTQLCLFYENRKKKAAQLLYYEATTIFPNYFNHKLEESRLILPLNKMICLNVATAHCCVAETHQNMAKHVSLQGSGQIKSFGFQDLQILWVGKTGIYIKNKRQQILSSIYKEIIKVAQKELVSFLPQMLFLKGMQLRHQQQYPGLLNQSLSWSLLSLPLIA